MFALDDEMLDLANELALENVAQKPFDHAILAGTLVSSLRLWNKGERGIAFAELDSDLQPWGQKGGPKDDLRKLYDDAHIWVYGDFTLQRLCLYESGKVPEFPFGEPFSLFRQNEDIAVELAFKPRQKLTDDLGVPVLQQVKE